MSELTQVQKDLINALLNGHNENVYDLIQRKVDLNFTFGTFGSNAKNRILFAGTRVSAHQDWTPLLYASYRQRITVDTMKVILDHGANVHWADSGGYTAMHFSSDKKRFFALLEAGADPHIKNHNGHSAIDLAENEGGPEWESIREEVELEEVRRKIKKHEVQQKQKEKAQRSAGMEAKLLWETAQSKGKRMVQKAALEAKCLVEKAQLDAKCLIEKAELDAKCAVTHAEAEGKCAVANAEAESKRELAEAEAEGSRLVATAEWEMEDMRRQMEELKIREKVCLKKVEGENICETESTASTPGEPDSAPSPPGEPDSVPSTPSH